VRLVVFALVAAAVTLAGCAGAGSPSPSPSSTPKLTTYAAPAFRFAVTYDAGLLAGAPDRNDIAGIDQWTLPGLGKLPKARTLLYVLRARKAAGVPQASPYAVLQITAIQPSAEVPRPTLTTFRNEPYMKSLTKRNATPYWASTPVAVTLGGLPAFRFVSNPPTARHLSETYTIVDGPSVFTLNLVLPHGTPASIASALRSALHSFRTTS
jgi:hypothetical protein